MGSLWILVLLFGTISVEESCKAWIGSLTSGTTMGKLEEEEEDDDDSETRGTEEVLFNGEIGGSRVERSKSGNIGKTKSDELEVEFCGK